jgi:hypothetical protein
MAEVLRDPKTARWLPGTPSPNPSGRRKREQWERELHARFPVENIANMLACMIAGIPIKPKDARALLKSIKDPGAKKSLRKYIKQMNDSVDVKGMTKGGLSTKDAIALLQWITEHLYGKAVTNISAEVDTKVTNVVVDLPHNKQMDIDAI